MNNYLQEWHHLSFLVSYLLMPTLNFTVTLSDIIVSMSRVESFFTSCSWERSPYWSLLSPSPYKIHESFVISIEVTLTLLLSDKSSTSSIGLWRIFNLLCLLRWFLVLPLCWPLFVGLGPWFFWVRHLQDALIITTVNLSFFLLHFPCIGLMFRSGWCALPEWNPFCHSASNSRHCDDKCFFGSDPFAESHNSVTCLVAWNWSMRDRSKLFLCFYQLQCLMQNHMTSSNSTLRILLGISTKVLLGRR